MHVIRKQLGKDECDGKLLLSLSMQSCAGHSPHTKVTIFSDKRVWRDKRSIKPGSSPWGSSPRDRLVQGPSSKRVSRNMLYFQAFKRAALSTERSIFLKKKSFLSYSTGHNNLSSFKISVLRITDGLWQELRSGITTFWLSSIWDGGGYTKLQKHSLVIRDTKGVW